MARFGLCVLFFLSGISGLVYQVVWVRQFGNLFGNTVHSAALVTALFMLGLGLGGFAAGRFADRQYGRAPGSMIRWYAYAELGIALLGLCIAELLPELEPLSARLASYVRGADGWYTLSFSSQLSCYSLAVLLVLPITTLMGGTLTLLIRHFVAGDLSVAGWRVGLLYGVNTAGASVGAFLVDFWLVPQLGLLSTQSVAALINLGVGLVALAWSIPRGAPVAETLADRALDPAGSPGSARIVSATSAALLLTGFCAMGMEILWFRHLTTVLGSHRATFSLLLTVILTGIWAGSILGAALHRRLDRPILLFMIAQTAFVVSVLALFRSYDPSRFEASDLIGAYAAANGIERSLIEVWLQLRPILWIVGLPALLMGFAYPLANANIQRAERSVATRAGLLYFANVAGAVLGALVTGFLLLPARGTQASLTLLAAIGMLALIPLWLALDRRPRLERTVVVGCAALGAATLASWAALPPDRLTSRAFRPATATERPIAFSEGINESIAITEDAKTGLRRLYTNGFSMSGTGYGGERYMRALAHIPLLSLDAPRRALVICFGVGNTLHAASLHPSLESLELVDLSRHVLEHAPYFSRWNRDVLARPGVSVYVNDGRQHLRMRPEGVYDLVTLEPPPIGHAGVSALYSREFYELAASRLRDGGQLSQWLPAYQLPGPYVASMVRSFVDVFPNAVLLSGHRSELILLGRKGGRITIDPDTLEARLVERDAVRADLADFDLATLTELVGTYAGSPASLARTAADSPPVTDDDPLIEYGPFAFRHTVIPETLFDTGSVAAWCPGCFRDGRLDERLPHLDTYLAALGTLYRSPAFRVTSDLFPVPPTPLATGLDPRAMSEALAASGYLRRLFREPGQATRQ